MTIITIYECETNYNKHVSWLHENASWCFEKQGNDGLKCSAALTPTSEKKFFEEFNIKL